MRKGQTQWGESADADEADAAPMLRLYVVSQWSQGGMSGAADSDDFLTSHTKGPGTLSLVGGRYCYSLAVVPHHSQHD